MMIRASLIFAVLLLTLRTLPAQLSDKPGSNPLIRDTFTADPATLVVGDTLYLYAGHDEAHGQEMFNLKDWLCYSTKDLKTWTAHGPIMQATDFSWAVKDAWAAQVVEKGGKFYFYTTVRHASPDDGMAIGVAISDSPVGPFKDARGSALITDSMTPGPYPWDDIDPTILIDDDGTAWLSWGNPNCYLARLKPNMTELDGPITKIAVPNYTEGPWLFKRARIYYLVYSAFAHQVMGEKICYATAPKITGPWTYRGILTGPAKNSYTIHPAVTEFKGHWLFFYHNATLELNGEKGAIGRRAVCADYLYFDLDGTIRPVVQTTEGLSVPPTPDSKATTSPAPGPSIADPGVKVNQEIKADPDSWPGKPVLATVTNPYNQATVAVGFNARGGCSHLGQIFKVQDGFELESIVLYAGDGFGATADESVRIGLYDLGTGEPTIEVHLTQPNLLGNHNGLQINYRPQPRGLLQIVLSDTARVALKAGHNYAFEVQGKPNSSPIFWYRSTKPIFKQGAAYADQKPIEEGGSRSDFAMALYATPH